MFNYSIFSIQCSPRVRNSLQGGENIMAENPTIFPKKVITFVAIIKKKKKKSWDVWRIFLTALSKFQKFVYKLYFNAF